MIAIGVSLLGRVSTIRTLRAAIVALSACAR
jgi:hypothetical protein